LSGFESFFERELDKDNRKYLNSRGIRFAGKPLGRPKVATEANRIELLKEKKRRREEYRQRIPIEGKFGQGKNGYRLNYIRTKSAPNVRSMDQKYLPGDEAAGNGRDFYFSFEKESPQSYICLHGKLKRANDPQIYL